MSDTDTYKETETKLCTCCNKIFSIYDMRPLTRYITSNGERIKRFYIS